MNAPVRLIETPTRHRFSVDEVIRMLELGLIDRDARMEVLDGELIDMPSEGELHLGFKIELNRFFVRAIGNDLRVAPDASLHLGSMDAPEPDIYVLDADVTLKPIEPSNVRLVLEIADSSLGYDLGCKAAKYAQYDIGEYWVVDVPARLTHVLRRPEGGVYQDITVVAFDQPLRLERIPGVELVIADLPGPKLP